MPADFLEQLVSLCRVAKQDTSHMLVEYSDVSIQKMRHMSNMALALSRDVLQGMVNFRIVVQPVVKKNAAAVPSTTPSHFFICNAPFF